MKKQIYDEKNGLSYTLHGGYYLPDLEINEEEPIYGKYGIMRKQFLKEHRSARYQYLVLTGKLTEHLNQVDKEVREKIEMLAEEMAEQWGVTEEMLLSVPVSDHEKDWEQLWSCFFNTIAIQERRNTDLQRSLMPLHYRTYMPEITK